MKSRIMHIFQVSLIGLALGLGDAAHAQSYPSRAVKLVIPFSAGATADTLGRLIARDMAVNLGQSVVVENKAGGGSTIGATSVARSAPDGYTLLLGSGSTHTVAPVVIKAMTYDPVKDFQPIGLVGSSSYVLVVHPKLPFNTLAELIEYGKENPQKLAYGSTGLGGAVHLATAMLEGLTGASFLHVPYRGGAPAIADLLAGQIDFALTTAENVPMISNGKLRALAVLGPKRLDALPEVPTCIEAGVPNCAFPVWNAVFVPADTPSSVTERLTKALAYSLAQPQTINRLQELGYEPGKADPQALARRVVEEGVFMHKIAEAVGIRPQ